MGAGQCCATFPHQTMPLTKHEVKERLGHGAMQQIATELGLSKSHVSRVLNEERPDRRVAVRVARRLRAKLADLPPRYYLAEPLRASA